MFFTTVTSMMPNGAFKRFFSEKTYLITYRILVRSLTGIVVFYNLNNRPAKGSICVANHTSILDVVIMSTDNNYSMVSIVVEVRS